MKTSFRYVVLASMAIVTAGPASALADPVLCQKQIARQYLKLQKVQLKALAKCTDGENVGKLPGPCPDGKASLKIATARQKAIERVAAGCTLADATALGFPGDCAFGASTTGVEGDCAALPVTTPLEFAACIACWKQAQFSEFIAILYASHAVSTCGGSLDATSPVCSPLTCATPLPDQRDLGDTGENDCQKAIGKGGVKYIGTRAKILEKCALQGRTEDDCEADPLVDLRLDRAEVKLETLVQNKCGNRDPVASPPFCCKTTGNDCVAAATRDDCEETLGGQAQEGKTCGLSNTCESAGPGGQKITWWESCPEGDTCPGTPLSSLSDLVGCVQQSADEIVDRLLCLQFPRNGGQDWECPPGSPSGAFLD